MRFKVAIARFCGVLCPLLRRSSAREVMQLLLSTKAKQFIVDYQTAHAHTHIATVFVSMADCEDWHRGCFFFFFVSPSTARNWRHSCPAFVCRMQGKFLSLLLPVFSPLFQSPFFFTCYFFFSSLYVYLTETLSDIKATIRS